MESYNSGFTQKEVENIKSGIIEEFNKSEHLDNSNVDLLTGQNYTVNLQINLHPVDSKKEAITKSWKYQDDPFNSAMLLEKAEETLVTLPEGSAGIMKGAATYGRLRISGGNNHNNIHNYFTI